MTTTIYAYIGRDNEEQFELLQAGSLVTAEAVTRAVLKSSSFCLDTDVDTTLIYFETTDNQTLCLKPGLITGLTTGQRIVAYLTLYDTVNTNGIAWEDFLVITSTWPVCT